MTTTGFRPAARRRGRVAAGVAVAAAAVGGNVIVYSSLDDRTEVLQVVADIRAGDLLTVDAVRIVEVDLDATVPVVPADQMAAVVDQYARVHIAAGTILAPVLVQPDPLVAPGTAVVAVELRPTLVPTGLRERSHVELVVPAEPTVGNDVPSAEPSRTTGRVVTRPTEVDGVSGLVSMSVEVPTASAAALAAADELRVLLLDPALDPLYTGSGA